MKHPSTGNILEDVRAELQRARARNAPLNSVHEAYAVILEELDELWDLTRKRREDRDPEQVLLELTQIAAVACRAAEDLDLIGRSTD